MDYFPYTVLFCEILFSVSYVDTLVLVRAPSPIVADMNKEPLSLVCSYKVTGSDDVLAVNWYHKTPYENGFRLIAKIPNQEVVNLPQNITDKGLASKSKISVTRTGSDTVVKLEINPAECRDEGQYKCHVLVLGDEAAHKAKVQVYLNGTEEPIVSLLSHIPEVLIDNRAVTFTCTASMGRPIGTFRWLLYRRRGGNSYQEVEMTGVTTFRKLPGNCSPTGTSTLAIMVTSADQKVKCVVEQQSEGGVVHVSTERQFEVKYRVRDTVIYSKVAKTHLPVTRDIQVQNGDDVNLVCRALGNPRPYFKWSYLPFAKQGGPNGLLHISTHPELTLTGITTNQSGSYLCAATNYISNREYTESRSVRIMVRERAAVNHQKLDGISVVSDVGRYLLIGGVVTGALLFTVFISLLSVMCVRRCSKKSLVHQIRYIGVRY